MSIEIALPDRGVTVFVDGPNAVNTRLFSKVMQVLSRRRQVQREAG